MADQSKIQWTDATWNPWHGCKKVSPGCKYCYMYRDKERWHQDPTTVVRSKANFRDPLNWKEPRKIFTCSWSDFFIEEADEWRQAAWEIIKATPQHTYQILTKRPERISGCLPMTLMGQRYVPHNAMIGISCENQEMFDLRWPILSELKRQIGVRWLTSFKTFLSLEPLIGPIDLQSMVVPEEFPNWIIVGGESGNNNGKYKYRECQQDWITSIINECILKEIPVFVKQMGTFLADELQLVDRHGGDIAEWPGEFKVREFPTR